MKEEIKKQIEEVAKWVNVNPIKIISELQSECAKIGDDKSLDILCKLKWDYIDAQ